MKRLTKKLELNWREIKYSTKESAEKKSMETKRKCYSKKKYFAEWRKDFQYSFINTKAKTKHLP